MENQHYNHVNQNDKNNHYNTGSSSSSSSTTTTTDRRNSTATNEGCRKILNSLFIEEFPSMYQDAIGTRPVQAIIKEVKENLDDNAVTIKQIKYALQQTAYAPRPSWAYARAVIRRLRYEGLLMDDEDNAFPF